jgi:hypothetical protein
MDIKEFLLLNKPLLNEYFKTIQVNNNPVIIKAGFKRGYYV